LTAAVSLKDRRARAKRAKAIAPATLARLAVQHPTAHCELDHRSPFELIVSVVLSAQTTDVAVNKVTPKLFERYPDARALAAAEPREVEPYVASLGFFRMKSKALVGLARALVERHGGEVPRSMGELVKLSGVGRKTANVVLGVLWNAPEGVVVDTHVNRISQRLGWTENSDPEKIERDLCAILPRSEWDHASHLLIFHGRYCCYARKPDCPSCTVNGVCPSAFDAEHVGRKAGPRRDAEAEEARAKAPRKPARAENRTSVTRATTRAAKATTATAGRGTRASPAPRRRAKA
jgi:endonuclease-3